MKCEGCLERLEEYLDGELNAREAGEVAGHLMTCAGCSKTSGLLSAEQEMFSRYDRELGLPASLWNQIAERIVDPVALPIAQDNFAFRLAGLLRLPSFGFSLATAVALIVIALVLGVAYRGSRRPDMKKLNAIVTRPAPDDLVSEIGPQPVAAQSDTPNNFVRAQKHRRPPAAKRSPVDQSDVLSSDFGYQDLDDQDTAKHLEQTQNLLRSIRNVQLNDSDQEIDVTYDKALSRRLLNENVVLRRDAEMKAKFPTKTLLSDLEPFLIDIANLPDQAKPEEVRAIKDRVRKTEIVAALIGY